FRCWRGSWRQPGSNSRRQPRITPFQEGCFPKGRSAETTQRKTKSLDIGSPPFDWLNTRLMMGSRHPVGKGQKHVAKSAQRFWDDDMRKNKAYGTTHESDHTRRAVGVQMNRKGAFNPTSPGRSTVQ